jgi:uncharacterized protein (DUF1501 family)
MRTSRRRFLTLAGTTSVVALANTMPMFLRRAAAAGDAVHGDKVLVVVQLTGGNDGLNTVIPYGDDAYHSNRFSLDYNADSVLKIDDYHGFHPSMRGFAHLLEEGKLSIVQGVGYPNPNRSHFESMDIWHTARRQLPPQAEGWLGRGLDLANRNGDDLPAVHLGAGVQPLALAARDTSVASFATLANFRLHAGRDAKLREAMASMAAAARTHDNEMLDFLQTNTTAAFAAAERIEQLSRGYDTPVAYPASSLAQHLKSVAQLIAAGMKTQIYYLTLDGFDTHSNQRDAHAALLSELSGAVHAFVADMTHKGHGDRVLVMTFSEFGRRVKENASSGTDHGAAAPMFLAGSKVRSGLVGKHPSLTDLIDGDMKFHTDFRRVYAAVLEDWLGWNPKAIVGTSFAPLDVVNG